MKVAETACWVLANKTETIINVNIYLPFDMLFIIDLL